MTVNFLYTATFVVDKEMDREFLGAVHSLIDNLLGSDADGLELVGHRLTINKVRATVALSIAVNAESLDAARETVRPLVRNAVNGRREPMGKWVFTVHSEEVLDLVVDRSSPAWERMPRAHDGFTIADRPDDGLVWELIDGVLCSKPLKTDAEARVISRLARHLEGDPEE